MRTTKIVPIFLLFIITSFTLSFAQQAKTIKLLSTSDTHSRIEPIDPLSADRYANMGGFVRRVTLINELRKENPNLLLFDCGDFSQGTPYYNLFQGEVEVKMMNLMHYDAVLIGNHEFDFGMDVLAHLFSIADFPVICSNYNVSNTVLSPYVKPYIIIEREGLKLGVIGVAPQLEGLVQADKYQGVVYENPITVANQLAAKLKNEEKCDAVICLSHLGVKDDEVFIKQSSNIDAVLGGHSHTFMDKPVFYINASDEKVPLLHTGKNGVFVGEMNLTFEKR